MNYLALTNSNLAGSYIYWKTSRGLDRGIRKKSNDQLSICSRLEMCSHREQSVICKRGLNLSHLLTESSRKDTWKLAFLYAFCPAIRALNVRLRSCQSSIALQAVFITSQSAGFTLPLQAQRHQLAHLASSLLYSRIHSAYPQQCPVQQWFQADSVRVHDDALSGRLG